MDRETAVERLNDLLELEVHGLPCRLGEVQSYVDWADAGLTQVLERIAADGRDNQRRLSEEIVRLGGMPRPVSPDIRSARVHYLEARYLLPVLIEEEQRLVSAYQAAAGEFSSTSEAAGVVEEILVGHRVLLEELEAVAAPPVPAEARRSSPATQADDA